GPERALLTGGEAGSTSGGLRPARATEAATRATGDSRARGRGGAPDLHVVGGRGWSSRDRAPAQRGGRTGAPAATDRPPARLGAVESARGAPYGPLPRQGLLGQDRAH